MTINPNQPPNLWDYKPWWCQPWSILLTGILLILGSWIFLHRFWITLVVMLFIGAWWAYFLILIPRLIAQESLLNQVQDYQAPE